MDLEALSTKNNFLSKILIINLLIFNKPWESQVSEEFLNYSIIGIASHSLSPLSRSLGHFLSSGYRIRPESYYLPYRGGVRPAAGQR